METKSDQSNLSGSTTPQRRRLRAVFAADIANFSGRVSVSETRAFSYVSTILDIGREELDRFSGHLLGIPGDGLFALFESASDAVQCALNVQARLADVPDLGGMKLRIGIHVGDVLFENNTPFGEALAIGARLESLADPGGILISGTVFEIVSSRISASFEPRGTPTLKNIPRRIPTYAVRPSHIAPTDLASPLDRTMDLATLLSTTQDRPTNPEAPSPSQALLSPEQQARLSESAAQYLGPVAAFMISRHMQTVSSTDELIATLANEIPNDRERQEFTRKLYAALS